MIWKGNQNEIMNGMFKLKSNIRLSNTKSLNSLRDGCSVLLILFVLASCNHQPKNKQPTENLVIKDTVKENNQSVQAESSDSVYHYTRFDISTENNNKQPLLEIRSPNDFYKSTFHSQHGYPNEVYLMKKGVCDYNQPGGLDELELRDVKKIRIDNVTYWLISLHHAIGGGSSTAYGCLKVFYPVDHSKCRQLAEIFYSAECEHYFKPRFSDRICCEM